MAVVRFTHTYYSPGDDVKSVLDGLPNQAQRSIDIEIYGFTDDSLTQGLIAAAKRGVNVRLMNDRSQSAGPSDRKVLQELVDARLVNIQVKIVESEKGAIDHLKLIIIDGEDGALADSSSVAQGSYNFSDGAQKQDNVFQHTNDPGLVAQAMAKFEHDWQFNEQKPEWQIQPSVAVVT